MQVIAMDILGWFDPIGWIGTACCGVIFIIGGVSATVLFLYFKKKRAHRKRL